MEREYEIGDKVWYANVGTQSVTETCEVCFGKRLVTVILGNGDEVVTPCDYCGNGYEGPKGVTSSYQYVAKPELVEITSKDVREGPRGKEIRYGRGPHGSTLEEHMIFDSEEEAAERARTSQLEHEARETANKKSRKENNYKSYSWHVGYHMKEAKEHHRKAEYHERRAALCKAASRKSNASASAASTQ